MSIDHAAEADVRLEDARDYSGEGEFALADLAVKSAQVHAALAMVEQQRVANLIAVRQMEGGPYKDINRWDDGDETDSLPLATQQIREGLGL
ncbi:hypothetical protein ACSAGD_10605 [Paramicrobacterium sp. CJ85]|uniref:hypothetical protein n=1 Tax=Paramicrobacterium sp. CJ85 TaxID=3445355 RepID=UPI003F61527C